MTDRLTDLLDRGVPDPPPLVGLAARAEADARRVRTRRRTAVGAAALALVAVSASFAVESRTPAPVAGDRVAPDPAGAVPCRPDAPLEVSSAAEPVSVRFCPPLRRAPGNRPGAALVPVDPLTTEVARTVAELDETVDRASRGFCVDERNPYSIQVGLADGTARRLSDEDCAQGFPLLLTAIGRQLAPRMDLDVPELTCSDRSPVRSDGPLLVDPLPELRRFPAVDAIRCSQVDDVRQVEQVPDPEALRADLLSSYFPGMVDCSGDPRGVVTTWILRLADGSLHAARIDGRACSPLTVDGTYLGLAGALLADRTLRTSR